MNIFSSGFRSDAVEFVSKAEIDLIVNAARQDLASTKMSVIETVQDEDLLQEEEELQKPDPQIKTDHFFKQKLLEQALKKQQLDADKLLLSFKKL